MGRQVQEMIALTERNNVDKNKIRVIYLASHLYKKKNFEITTLKWVEWF